MNRTLLIIISLIIMVAIAAGCGKKSTTTVYSGKDGAVKVTEAKGGEGGKVEVETKEGKFTAETKKTVNEAELGIPIYPGAKVEDGASYEGTGDQGAGKVESYVFATPDSFEKVEAFYKSKLKDVKNQFSSNQEDQKTAMFSMGDDNNGIHLTVNWKKGEKHTGIIVMKSQKL